MDFWKTFGESCGNAQRGLKANRMRMKKHGEEHGVE
jgi:hypothetical protein